MSREEKLRKIKEQTEKEKAELVKKFNVGDFIVSEPLIRTVEDPKLGQITFKILTGADWGEFVKLQRETGEETTLLMIYLALKDQNPDITIESLKKMPMTAFAQLQVALAPYLGFFPPKS